MGIYNGIAIFGRLPGNPQGLIALEIFDISNASRVYLAIKKASFFWEAGLSLRIHMEIRGRTPDPRKLSTRDDGWALIVNVDPLACVVLRLSFDISVGCLVPDFYKACLVVENKVTAISSDHKNSMTFAI